jgi:hypothetical protein
MARNSRRRPSPDGIQSFSLDYDSRICEDGPAMDPFVGAIGARFIVFVRASA